MPKIPFTIQPLMINLPDYESGDISFKRKAEVIEETWDLRGQQVRLVYDVIPFARNEDGTYGDRLDKKDSSIVAMRILVSAQNIYFVNAQTGRVLCETKDEYVEDRSDPENPVSALNPVLANAAYMKDYDFYFMLATSKQIILAQLIGGAILANY